MATKFSDNKIQENDEEKSQTWEEFRKESDWEKKQTKRTPQGSSRHNILGLKAWQQKKELEESSWEGSSHSTFWNYPFKLHIYHEHR